MKRSRRAETERSRRAASRPNRSSRRSRTSAGASRSSSTTARCSRSPASRSCSTPSLDLITRGEHEQAREILDRALARTRTTIGELRDLSFNLEPVVAARPRVHDGGATRSREDRAASSTGSRSTLDVAPIGDARRADAGCAVPDRARGARGARSAAGPPKTFAVDRPPPSGRDARDDDPRRRAERAPAALDRGARGARAHARRGAHARARRSAARRCASNCAASSTGDD